MKSKCSFILKASTALLLALLMLFGTVASSVAAVVRDTANTGAKADLAETGADIVSDGTMILYINKNLYYSGNSSTSDWLTVK